MPFSSAAPKPVHSPGLGSGTLPAYKVPKSVRYASRQLAQRKEMMMLAPRWIHAMLIVPLCPGSVLACGGRGTPPTSGAYYPAPRIAPVRYLAPAPYAPVASAEVGANPAPCVPIPTRTPATMPYAIPTEAPASTLTATQEPPKVSPPAVSESRYFDAYPRTDASQSVPAPYNCRVTFWNLSPGPLTLLVGGRAQTLARGKSAIMQLPWEFVWRVAGRETRTQQVPLTETALDVVIRR